MRNQLYILCGSVGIVCCIAGFLSCGKKQETAGRTVALIGSDTLTCRQARELAADTSLSKQNIRRSALLLSLSRQSQKPSDSAAHWKAMEEMANQMSLRSSRQWNPGLVSAMAMATQTIKGWLDTTRSIDAVVQRIDSLYNSVVIQDGSAAAPDSIMKGLVLDTQAKSKDVRIRAALIGITGTAFNLPPDMSDIIVGYLYEEKGSSGTEVTYKRLVKGLLFDSTQKPADRASMPMLERQTVDNSALALRYRTRQSIMDSIGRHVPHLQSIYKKQLKINQAMAGTIWVSFRVNPSGAIMSAHIVRSDIAEKDFLNPFLSYVQSMRFCSIPEKIGPMSFEFPFEFKAED